MIFRNNVKDFEAIIDSLVRKGVAYAVALFPFLHSHDEYRYASTIRTLEPAFGRDVAEKIYKELEEAFKNVDLGAKLIIEGRKISLEHYLQDYILRDEVTKVIVDEIGKRVGIDKRVSSMPKEDREILSIACAIIEKYENKSYPGIIIKPLVLRGGIEILSRISPVNYDYFSLLVSSILGVKIDDIRAYFYKYLLGFEVEQYLHSVWFEIYPFATPYVSLLGTEAEFEYIDKKFTDKRGRALDPKLIIMFKLELLYRMDELYKLALIWHSLSHSPYGELELISQFTGLSREQLCNVVVEDVISKCFIDPFTYEYVKDAITELHGRALANIMTIFRIIFEGHGYSAICIVNNCIFTKDGTKPIYIRFHPWIETKYFFFIKPPPNAVKVIVIQGIPVASFINSQIVQDTGSEGYLWLFIEKNKIAIASNTYKHEDHYEFLKILKNYFILEILGPIPKELESLIAQVKPIEKPEKIDVEEHEVRVEEAEVISDRFVSVKPSREVLEGIVAEALKSLGFSVQTNAKLPAKGGDIEADVWGVKSVGSTQFRVYVSCKNWSKDVDRTVVDQEFGRVLQLYQLPHLRILVVKSLSESARKAALDNGFFVIELGEKTTTGNAREIYNIVYNKLKEIFIGIASKRK
jgi:hypothetical protein